MLSELIKFIGSNCGNPKGIMGKLVTTVMNIMNQKQYKAVLDNIKSEPD